MISVRAGGACSRRLGLGQATPATHSAVPRQAEEVPALNLDTDTDGTMTDGLVSDEGDPFSVKVETTPHHVTIALTDALQDWVQAVHS